MTLQQFKTLIPDYAKDIKLNLSAVLENDSESGLTEKDRYAIALAVALTTEQPLLLATINTRAHELLADNELNAVKAATSLMAMNNIYYRTLHMLDDKEFSRLPAGLRMNILGNPGVDKEFFELLSLAVSAINGCGMCIKAHTVTLTKAGMSLVVIQHAVRIAAVVNAAAQVEKIEKLNEESTHES